jgi:hypothetical protein
MRGIFFFYYKLKELELICTSEPISPVYVHPLCINYYCAPTEYAEIVFIYALILLMNYYYCIKCFDVINAQ